MQLVDSWPKEDMLEFMEPRDHIPEVHDVDVEGGNATSEKSRTQSDGIITSTGRKITDILIALVP